MLTVRILIIKKKEVCKMEDFDGFDDFSDDFEDNGDSFEDDFGPEDSFDDSVSDETQDDSTDDDATDIDWEDMAIIGGMAEEFAEEEKERRRIEREVKKDTG